VKLRQVRQTVARQGHGGGVCMLGPVAWSLSAYRAVAGCYGDAHVLHENSHVWYASRGGR
jgi:hypothetical protein